VPPGEAVLVCAFWLMQLSRVKPLNSSMLQVPLSERTKAALRARAASIDAIQWLMTIPGIGLLVATAIYVYLRGAAVAEGPVAAATATLACRSKPSRWA